MMRSDSIGVTQALHLLERAFMYLFIQYPVADARLSII
jgi:hypothetical protein